MITIADLVRDTLGPDAVVDRRLGWGACSAAYADEIAATLAASRVPVLVELRADPVLAATAIVVDHHGPDVGTPSSLAQVFALLRRPATRWTRRLALVDANDVGHVPGLKALGASRDELAAIRLADRRAQGITAAQEIAGRRALRNARRHLGGRVLTVRLPHRRSATVTDPVALDRRWADVENLLVLMPGEVGFFGSGAGVVALDRAFPGGWTGGALPRRGFWGRTARTHRLDPALLAVLDRTLPCRRRLSGSTRRAKAVDTFHRDR
ncbi:MAG: hypothetical protein HXX10_08395 [Rhodoplanes sp.]|uniref:hypothetical protein n=1 Tax=Rhodoplanes sp. TaxID=1968906 RepID=UPI001817FE14|nr:hypothetical protein [Rhodoplanes sp.]NVO14041.1 hypothetical protein [Rhodoplanes sp.]